MLASAVYLIGIFGNKEGIAEVGALSRIAMLFIFLRRSAGILVGRILPNCRQL